MNKRELIDEIMKINHSARPEFLAHFKESHLIEYLDHLHEVENDDHGHILHQDSGDVSAVAALSNTGVLF